MVRSVKERRLIFRDGQLVEPETGSKAKGSGGFLRGPIPLWWLSKAAGLPGKALHIALALQYLGGMKRRGERAVKVTDKVRDTFNVSRWAYYKALESLEKAGLISVERNTRSTAIVTILDTPTD